MYIKAGGLIGSRAAEL